MLLGIDHLVIAVRDPDAAAAALERDLGLAFTGGGRHEAWGTFNRLAFLGDTYLELIGVFDRGARGARRRGPPWRGRRWRSSTRAARAWRRSPSRPTTSTATSARLRARGSPIGAPVDGSRARPDGEVVRWRTAAARRSGRASRRS